MNGHLANGALNGLKANILLWIPRLALGLPVPFLPKSTFTQSDYFFWSNFSYNSDTDEGRTEPDSWSRSGGNFKLLQTAEAAPDITLGQKVYVGPYYTKGKEKNVKDLATLSIAH